MNIRTEKYCGSCRAVKPRSEFNKHSTSKDGLRNYCRTCQKRYAARYRATHPKCATQLARQRAYNKLYRMAKREQINLRRKAARLEQKRIQSIRLRFANSYAE